MNPLDIFNQPSSEEKPVLKQETIPLPDSLKEWYKYIQKVLKENR